MVSLAIMLLVGPAVVSWTVFLPATGFPFLQPFWLALLLLA